MEPVYKDIINIVLKGPKVMVVFCALLISIWFFTIERELHWILSLGLAFGASAIVWIAYDFFKDKATNRKEKVIKSIITELNSEIEIRINRSKKSYREKSFNKKKDVADFEALVYAKIEIIKSLRARPDIQAEAIAIIERTRETFIRRINSIGPHGWML